MDRDKVTIKLLNSDLFIGARSQQPIIIDQRQEYSGLTVKLNGEGRKSRGDEAFFEEATKQFENAVSAIMAGSLVMSVFLSVAIQMMWGMINSL